MFQKSLIASLVALTACLSGCSLLVEFDECSTSAECADSGVCNDGICEAPSGPAACTKGSDCGSGPNTYCFSGLCRTVDTAKCKVEGNAFAASAGSTIVPVGVLLSTSTGDGVRAQAGVNGAKLALDQINAQSGFAGGEFGLVVCDTAFKAETAVAQAKYASEELGIKAFIGAQGSSETLEVANQVAIPGKLLMISPASTSPAITGLNDTNLVWRTIASDSLQGPAMAKLVKQGGYQKIALLSVASAYGDGFRSVIQDYWATNEPTLLSDQSRYKSLQFSAVDFTSEIATIGDQLFGASGFKPDVVIVIGTATVLELIASLESLYVSKLDEADRPVWIGGEATKTADALAVRFEDIWPRLQGTVIQQRATPLYAQFSADYRSAFMSDPTTFIMADKGYDAAYLIAMAYASQAEPFKATGVELSQVLGRVSTGAKSEAKATQFSAAVRTLSQGGSINFDGVSGPLDFDANGDVFGDIASWSIEPPMTAGDAATFKDGPVIP